MADEDVKVYTRGGRLAFTADVLRNHIGETATLSFWIRLGEGAVEGHSVAFYHYQSSGVGISYDRSVSDITSDWSYREITGTVVDRGTHNTGEVYDGSQEYYIDYDYNPSAPNGTSFSFGEMWFYDRTGSQKYEVAGIQLTLAGGVAL